MFPNTIFMLKRMFENIQIHIVSYNVIVKLPSYAPSNLPPKRRSLELPSYAHTGFGSIIAQWLMMWLAISKPLSQIFLSVAPS